MYSSIKYSEMRNNVSKHLRRLLNSTTKVPLSLYPRYVHITCGRLSGAHSELHHVPCIRTITNPDFPRHLCIPESGPTTTRDNQERLMALIED